MIALEGICASAKNLAWRGKLGGRRECHQKKDGVNNKTNQTPKVQVVLINLGAV